VAAETHEKMALLAGLLAHYNAGRQKSLFAAAVNLLPLEDLRTIRDQLTGEAADLPLKERAQAATALLRRAANSRGVDLKPRKKPK